MRYLTFALTKGRLAKKTMELLEQLGITCEEIQDKNSRKLIFVNEELKLKFFLAKILQQSDTQDQVVLIVPKKFQNRELILLHQSFLLAIFVLIAL